VLQQVLAALARLTDADRSVRLLDRLQLALVLAGAADLSWRLHTIAPTGARILRLLTGVLANTTQAGTAIASTLSAAWGCQQPCAERLLNAALILCADHELNASAFAARVAASAAANPYAVVSAGLATLQGARHGGQTESAEALLRDILLQMRAPDDRHAVTAVLTERLRRGDTLPGFGHRLYPAGDPRTAVLFAMLQEYAAALPPDSLPATVLTVCETIQALVDDLPNIDWALAALVQALELPRGAGLVVFALGRTVGFLGHAIEQYHHGKLIRPRAIYTGAPPRRTGDGT
jgi:citrate synthase